MDVFLVWKFDGLEILYFNSESRTHYGPRISFYKPRKVSGLRKMLWCAEYSTYEPLFEYGFIA